MLTDGRSSKWILLAILFSLTVACSTPGYLPADDAAATVLYRNARLVVGDGSVIENGALLVEGRTITAVGTVDQVNSPPGARIVELADKTIMPAMIDAHAHLGYEGYRSWGAENYTLQTLTDHFDRYSYYGFAAVFSAGSDPDELALDIQRAQQSGAIGGARFLFAAGMAPPGQGPNDQFLVHALTVQEEMGMIVLRGLGDTRQARAAVQEAADKGIAFIKIWVDDRGGSQVKLSPEIYQAVLDEARLQGLKVFVHQQVASDMPQLLVAGVDGFLHGRLGPELDKELAAQIAEAGAFVVPNLGLGELRRESVADDDFLQQSINEEVIVRLNADFQQRQSGGGVSPGRERELVESFGHLLAADVDILLGTDAGAIPNHFFGYTGHRELEIFVRLGMTPMGAIQAATSLPAKHLGLDDLGTLAAGKSADFIILNANPLEDIRNTRTIAQVYQAGRQLDRQAMRQRWTGPQ